jgi:hypothetical protein
MAMKYVCNERNSTDTHQSISCLSFHSYDWREREQEEKRRKKKKKYLLSFNIQEAIAHAIKHDESWIDEHCFIMFYISTKRRK